MAGRQPDHRVGAAIQRARKAGLRTLSPRALELLCLLVDRRNHGLPKPTYREMQALMGLTGKSLFPVQNWLRELQAAGCVAWEKWKWGTLRVLVRIEPVRHDQPAADPTPTTGSLARD